ncbi:UPF0478 protein YtxG [Oceanobacillus oncorhynchi subsp. incaldanensis]|uniref:General stress protein n=1 Tax=Oceanobacillus oncorhynchi TaxID=545501 RepID=A0A0A1MPY7_9BACI|nr:DUF948 domain-containing protein [Oceanobacillus oncorhynchi]UUI40267.1 DUF948 domain-containing protein [Oceanobacillus oncorhynchi]GIO21349.1 UPF0478 protein YtxG [Oceanobacillus oncorhynchi subsp. incaldanensis]CEI81687.1 hypothetical protein BN997_01522 [Oceanobacillus oncorhynchi]
MPIISVGILLVAIAFAVVCCYIAFMLNRLTYNIRSLGKSVVKMEEEMNHITPEISKSLQEVNHLIDDTHEKLQATDSVFGSLEDVGTSVQSLNEAYKVKRQALDDAKLEEKLNLAMKGITWSEAAMQIYKSYQAGKTNKVNQTREEVK